MDDAHPYLVGTCYDTPDPLGRFEESILKSGYGLFDDT